LILIVELLTFAPVTLDGWEIVAIHSAHIYIDFATVKYKKKFINNLLRSQNT